VLGPVIRRQVRVEFALEAWYLEEKSGENISAHVIVRNMSTEEE
jgi:hypothetical protein